MLMNVLISVSQSFSVMRMHSVSTQLAAISVSAMMATLETVLPAIVNINNTLTTYIAT